MRRALHFIRDGYGDSSFIPLKEWANQHGEMGVYRSQKYGFVYVLVLLNTSEFYQQQYVSRLEQNALIDAEIIARFAGLSSGEQ